MNYKVMQRPMFRLGGTARKNYQKGTGLEDLESLIGEIGTARDKYFKTQRAVLPFQALSGQMEDIRSIRSLGDITNILSNLGQSPELFGALGKLPGIELKQKKGELEDKLSIIKARNTVNKKYEFERRLEAAKNISKQQESLLAGKSAEEQKAIRQTPKFKALQQEKNYLLRELSEKAYLLQRSSKGELGFDIEQAKKDYDRITSEFSTGGRVGYQQGTPDPDKYEFEERLTADPDMVMPQPKPEEAMNDRKLDTLMTAAPAMEDPNQARSMGDKDMYAALRRRLPPEITDDVVRLIAYNQEAFADFANISDQSDVESFNQKYNVELVLPVGNQ